jgi:dihydroxyacetone kinase DhaKLM complex PTS-EIIA-like component DhaM
VAFYFSASGDRFLFSVADVHGDIQSIDLAIGKDIPIYKFVGLTCQVGLGTNETYLQVLIDGKQVQAKTVTVRMDLGSRQWNGTIGADLKGQNNAAFESLAISAFGHVTLTEQQVRSFTNRIAQLLRDLGRL